MFDFSPNPSPVLVMGAGLMGRLLACSLVRHGHRVRIVDAGPADGSGAAASIAAAMLAPLAESAIAEAPVVAMGYHGLQRWPELLADLPQPVFFQRNGTLVVWHRQDSHEGQRFAGLLGRTVQALPGSAAPQNVGALELEHLEPALAGRFQRGLYLPDEGQLDNRQLLQALLLDLENQGVTVEWDTPINLTQAKNWQAISGGWVLDCRGMGSRSEWAPDNTTALRGVRGEVARIHAPDVSLQRPTRLLHPRYPIYIAPKENHLFVIGATEIESDDMSPVSVRSTLELLSAAYAVHPGFAEGRILELRAHCRPTLPNNLPAVHAISPRVLQINGLYRHGFMISPAVHDAVLEWITHGRLDVAQRLQLRFDLSALS